MKAINKIKLVIVGMIIIGLAVLCPFNSYASEVDSIEIIDFGLYQTTFAQWKQAPDTQRGEIKLLVQENSFDVPREFPARVVRNSAFVTW